MNPLLVKPNKCCPLWLLWTHTLRNPQIKINGDTRALCKKYQVHPHLLESYEQGPLEPYLQLIKEKRTQPAKGALHHDEKVLLTFLKRSIAADVKKRKSK